MSLGDPRKTDLVVWTYLNPTVEWVDLKNSGIQVTTADGKRYRFGAGYASWIRALSNGMNCDQIEYARQDSSRFSGLIVTLDELGLCVTGASPPEQKISLIAASERPTRVSRIQILFRMFGVAVLVGVLLCNVALLWNLVVACLGGNYVTNEVWRIDALPGKLLTLTFSIVALTTCWITGHEYAHFAIGGWLGLRGRVGFFNEGRIWPRYIPENPANLQAGPGAFWVFLAGPAWDQLLSMLLLLAMPLAWPSWMLSPIVICMFGASPNLWPTGNADFSCALKTIAYAEPPYPTSRKVGILAWQALTVAYGTLVGFVAIALLAHPTK